MARRNRNAQRAVRAALLLALASCAARPLRADEAASGSHANPYRVPRASSPIRIDGDLQEEAWTRATLIELEFETRPRENAPPPVRTQALLLYDRSNFYVGFRAYDPDPSSIRAYLSDRDALGGDDWVAVEIDTYNDSRRAFTLFSTPLGVQMDGLSDSAGVKDYNWDTIYDAAGKILDWGYSVEMAIPFSSLRFQRTTQSQVWGINIVRGYPREVSHQIWARPYDRANNCRVCQYLRIEGFEDVSPGHNVEINPTLIAVSTRERDALPDGAFSERDAKLDPGLTARWGMTPNLYLSGTLNPDFSQVEADAAQLDVNQPFALFYAEKRPFFTEGADFFKTPLSVTYTRTLRDPQWGLRLSGKEAANAIGAFLVEDRLTNLIFPGSQSSAATSLQQHSTAASLRYSRDVGRSSSLGLAVTSRSGGDYFNRVYGADGTLRFSPKDELELQALGSSTRYDDATAEAFAQPAGEFHDKALSARYVRKSRYHRVELGYLDIGPEFRADLGFLPQVGLRRFSAVSEHEWIPKTSGWWSRFRLSNAARYSSEQGGPLLDKALDNQLSYEGPLQSQLSIGNQLSRQLYNGVEFGLSSWRASVFVQPTGAVGLYLPTSFGDGIDFANTRKGSRWRIAPSLTLNLGRHLRLDLGHTYERMSVAGARLYTAHLSEGAALYHFNARTFLRAIVQYYDYEYNVENYLQPREPVSRQLFTQLLFSYKLNARTVLFVGYSDNGFGSADFGVTRTDYTLFVKLGYAWVL